tara:strand:+ start:456 stop:566 length:111 start_codon:yes stop_codon:yes gene_type:complete
MKEYDELKAEMQNQNQNQISQSYKNNQIKKNNHTKK